jgi:UDP-GlcNAc3NAcA epimerase
VAEGEFFLATVHRAKNTDDRRNLRSILEGLRRAALLHPVIFPAHPRTRPLIEAVGIPDGIRVSEPLGHGDTMALAQRAAAVLTDSGGLQKETYWLKTPCVTMRNETEWIETVETGWNRLTGANPTAIEAAVSAALQERHPHPELYGDGHAARRIVDHLLTG